MKKTKFIPGILGKFNSSLAAKSSLWVTIGMLGSQVIRLASNLLLTRLLVPEYFGMMAIVYSVLGFFTMMSDVGLVPSVINTKRDKDSEFMSTIWTIKVLSALFLAFLLVISAYPISYVYDEPLLFPILIIIASTSVIGGFNSIALVLEQKYLRQKKLVLSQLCTQILSSLCMILIAYYTHSIWSLVAGNILSVIVALWYSYNIFSPHYSTFRLEARSVKEIVIFGKWILLSSILSYAGNRSRPVVMAFWVSFSQLGIYSVAASLATVVEAIVGSLSSKILYPKYRQFITDGNITSINKLRKKFILLFLPLTIVIAVIGEYMVKFLYDDRYQEAGAILQILAVGRIGSLFVLINNPILLAIGDSRGFSFSQGITAVASIFLVVAGGVVSGFYGMVVGAALIPFVDYMAVNTILKKHEFDFIMNDIFIMLISISIIVVIWQVNSANSFRILVELFGF